jgi:5'-nucleotidase
MHRREFIKNASITGLLASTGGLALAGCTEKKPGQITILHTNDVHSHVLPFAENHPEYANLGGVARRSKLIESIRTENKNTLLFDAGDIFQGTPYFNYFGGEVEFKLMSMLGYDAATIGNHDFDNGIDGLDLQLPHAKFDFLISNYDLSNTVLNGKTKKYRIFDVDGLKIGVFGLGIALDGLVSANLFKETRYLDPVEISQEMTNILKQQEKCDLVICLSHLGYYYKSDPEKICDLNLAKKTRDIDLIIGGHTHTFLPKPTLVKNLDNQNMLVNQVGKWGLHLGRVDFYFDSAKNVSTSGKQILLS